MLELPIDHCHVDPHVMADLLGFEPLMPQDLVVLGLQFPIKQQVFN